MMLLMVTMKAGLALGAGPASPLDSDAWKNLERTVPTPAQLDQLLEKEIIRVGRVTAPLCNDADFYRRVSLDITGKLPTPVQLRDFAQDSTPNKRAKLIDKLLESEEYSRYWAQYWAEVIAAKVTDRRGLLAYRPFEDWMALQLKNNTPWNQIAHELITAEGEVMPGDKSDGRTFLMLGHLGPDGPVERASEVSRIFLGIQIQCAQCHDHPSDVWKREQFHEFAAYFARTGDRLVPAGNMRFGLRVHGRFFGEHKMPSKEDPAKGTTMHPRFLDGSEGPKNASDKKRREALVASMTSQDNPWFAAAYVNRIWGKLLGQGFYQPIDDMGPQKELVQQEAFLRLVGAFQAMKYDSKAFLRLVLNTKAYQRQTRLGETQDEHLLFAAVYPSRLDAEAFWQSLNDALGQVGGPFASFNRLNPLFFARSYEGQFRNQFKFDPSFRADEVEGSVAQALWMMNNPQIEEKILTRPGNFLGKLLKDFPDDSQALRILYARVLSRLPMAGEEERCKAHLAKAKNREEAFEDILWALINTTEFQSRR